MALCGNLPLLLLLIIIITTSNTSTAQSPPIKTNTTNSNEPSIPQPNNSPSVSIMVIVLISAFVFLAFFSVSFRRFSSSTSSTSSSTEAPATRARSVKRPGLDPEILSTFPTLIYSEVKEHKLSKSALECAVCLNEFDDDETLRLLPNCSHAFHTDCIDAWLAAHITCPVCRCNLTEPVKNKDDVEEHVVVDVVDDEERKREMNELEEFVTTKRARYLRSYTTGHAAVQREENLERYTLKLPENVRNVLMLKRTSSCVAFTREESEKKGFRATEKLGSFLKRTMTMKKGKFFRWDSSKSEAAPVRPKSSSFRHVVSTFDCCPGGGSSSTDYNQLNKGEKSSITDS